MLPKPVETAFFEVIEKHFDNLTISRVTPCSGGCINSSYYVATSRGTFFLKYNYSSRFPEMFEKEALGLEILGDAGKLRVPLVYGNAEAKDQAVLVLENIEEGSPLANFWEDFGKGLARLHKTFGKNFGLDHDNYIGSLFQANKPAANWIDFFVEQRLEAQIKLASDTGKAGPELGRLFRGLYPYLSEFFPEEPPALLHGDLWSGNYMTAEDGQAVIIDPAVYYGHRYMDLGMSKLFGGYAPGFYQAYKEEYPMEKGWEKSMEIANLYPLMVHVNLFGGGYLGSVKIILGKFR